MAKLTPELTSARCPPPARTGDTKHAGNKLAKLKTVNDWLRDNCERAWDIEPEATLDESRLRLHSRYCSFVTEMICKPIKTGCTIYCVNFSKSSYLYTWARRRVKKVGAGSRPWKPRPCGLCCSQQCLMLGSCRFARPTRAGPCSRA